MKTCSTSRTIARLAHLRNVSSIAKTVPYRSFSSVVPAGLAKSQRRANAVWQSLPLQVQQRALSQSRIDRSVYDEYVHHTVTPTCKFLALASIEKLTIGYEHNSAITPCTSSFRNIFDDSERPPVMVDSCSETSFKLTDGIILPCNAVFHNGSAFMWDVPPPSFTWKGWSQDMFQIFEFTSPKPGASIEVFSDSITSAFLTDHRYY